MPEGPEVKIITNQLRSELQNTTLNRIEILGGPYLTNNSPKYTKIRDQFIELNQLLPMRIVNVDCKGKQLWFELEGKTKKYLMNHLAMSGHWRKNQGKHSYLVLYYDADESVWFDDVRHFGTFAILGESDFQKKISQIGPDILSSGTSKEIFMQQMNLKKSQNKPIAEVLVNQNIISGIGNYLRADILYYAKINPLTLVSKLDSKKLNRIYISAKKIANASLESKGTTIKTYKDIYMQPGQYQPLIYEKNSDIFGNKVKSMQFKNRTLYWVPALQK